MSGALAMTLLGAIFGSFAAAASWRLPREITLWGRSACPHCGRGLVARDLVPILSWLVLRGRCRSCGVAIGLRYPLIEAATAALFLLSWLCADDWPTALLLAAVSTAAMVIVATDLEHRIIPDAALIPLVPVALLWRWSQGLGLLDAVATALVAGLLAFALQWGFRRWRGFDGLGSGDVKFLAVAGLFLGSDGMAAFLVIAGTLGMVFGLIWRALGRGNAFPFGPALVGALLLGLFWPPLLML